VRIANRREDHIRDLYAFSRRLGVAHEAADIFQAIQEHLSSVLGRKVVLFGAPPGGAAKAQSFGTAGIPDTVRDAVRSIGNGKENHARVLDDGTGNLWLVRALSPSTLDYGVIAVDLGNVARESEHDIRQRIEAHLADATATLEHLGIASAIADARMRAETNRFREALIGSVSHELRTPLASILGATTVLCGAPAVQREGRLLELASVAREEAERLNNDIQRLLDASRISSEGVQPKFEWTEPIDIVNSALQRSRNRLSDHVVEVSSTDELPILYVDSALVEQALGQVIDNAGKYSNAGSTVRIEGRCDNGHVVISVKDQGSGVSAEDQPKIGERFFRSKRHLSTTTGAGLGLWIANAFLAANGGKLDVTSDGEGYGTVVSIRLPVPSAKDIHASVPHE